MTANSGNTRLTWYIRGVTIALIICCNGLLVLGWWVSGVNLEVALSKPALYDVTSHYCVGVKWMKVEGVEQPMKVCAAWLDLSDPTGATHTIRPGHALTVGADGALHYADQRHEDYRLMGLVLFVLVVFGAGMWAKHYLITRYTMHLQRMEGHVS